MFANWDVIFLIFCESFHVYHLFCTAAPHARKSTGCGTINYFEYTASLYFQPPVVGLSRDLLTRSACEGMQPFSLGHLRWGMSSMVFRFPALFLSIESSSCFNLAMACVFVHRYLTTETVTAGS